MQLIKIQALKADPHLSVAFLKSSTLSHIRQCVAVAVLHSSLKPGVKVEQFGSEASLGLQQRCKSGWLRAFSSAFSLSFCPIGQSLFPVDC